MEPASVPRAAVEEDNATPPASGYSVVVADLLADRSSIIDLWRRNPLQPALVEAKYQWFYLDNPDGTAGHLLLCHGPQAECVGATGLVTRKLVARGVELSAGQLTDFFVLPRHRTVFPALLLQRQMRTTGLGTHDLLYGYPNDKARAILRRIGYVQIGDLAKFVVLLRYGEYLERWMPRWLSHATGAVIDRALPWIFRPYRLMLGRWHGDWTDAPDDRFDALWKRAKRFDGIIGVRDRRFLSWRYFARPGHQYRLFVLSDQRTGEIAAYAVCEALGDTLHIRDMLFDIPSTEPLRVLLHLLSRQAYRQGIVRLSFDLLGDDRLRGALRAAGMFERAKTPLLASFSPETKSSVQGLDWYLTAADTEL